MVKGWSSVTVAAALFLYLPRGAALAASVPPCASVMPPASTGGSASRALSAVDLVGLRDIGPNSRIGPTDPAMTVSPQGDHAAFQLRQADPETNRYCLAMVVLDLRSKASPILVDAGGDLIRIESDVRGVAATPSGIPRPITPRWSSDSRWVAFLKRTGGITQIWRAEADGTGSHALTKPELDVTDFRFATDGTSIIFQTRPSRTDALAMLEQEGRTGYAYDARFTPLSGALPHVQSRDDAAIYVLDVQRGQVTRASTRQADWLREQIRVVQTGLQVADGPDGRSARLIRTVDDPMGLQLRLQTVEHGVRWLCEPQKCRGRLISLWWTSDGRRIRYIRQEGWGFSETAIYEWDPAGEDPRRLFLTSDQLSDCGPLGPHIVCLDDAANAPRRVISIDPDEGRTDVLFDPNPEFRERRLGAVERLQWKNKFGLPSFGDLVLPVGYRPGQRYPLIVVQYESRGFLRGGTGDEYPIQAFANRGYAVLSFERPLDIGIVRAPTDVKLAEKLDQRNFADRRSVLSSLERGVRLIIARGIADPRRIGITGMSDGAATVQYALLHSRLFSAAAISNCCTDATTAIVAGPAAAGHFLAEGYPRVGEGQGFWRHIALSRNAGRLNVPILMQLPDGEYLAGLDAYTGLHEAGKPVSLYVFPDEHHVKWQPSHRLAIYRRSLDWFDYWLQDRRSADPARADDLVRWDALPRPSPRPITPRASKISLRTNDPAMPRYRARQGS